MLVLGLHTRPISASEWVEDMELLQHHVSHEKKPSLLEWHGEEEHLGRCDVAAFLLADIGSSLMFERLQEDPTLTSGELPSESERSSLVPGILGATVVLCRAVLSLPRAGQHKLRRLSDLIS